MTMLSARVASPTWRSGGCPGGPARAPRLGRSVVQGLPHAPRWSVKCAAFPMDYAEAVAGAQRAVRSAVEDGKALLEVDFPVAGLEKCAGDEEASTENNLQAKYLREFCRMFAMWDAFPAKRVRVCFPDEDERAIAVRGSDGFDKVDAVEATFHTWPGPVDHLFEKNVMDLSGLTALLGRKPAPGIADRVAEDDAALVLAYPSYNIDELVAAEGLYAQEAARPEGRRRPIVLWNAELDRLRSGYYPAFWSRKELSTCKTGLLPHVETAYYIHNYKGSRPGVLFRAYPGPWQVLLRPPGQREVLPEPVWTGDAQPDGKTVALDILPNAYERLLREK